MDYAGEREYRKVHRAIVLTKYIVEHGSISREEAMRITGASYYQLYRLLLDIEYALNAYQDGGQCVLCEE